MFTSLTYLVLYILLRCSVDAEIIHRSLRYWVNIRLRRLMAIRLMIMREKAPIQLLNILLRSKLKGLYFIITKFSNYRVLAVLPLIYLLFCDVAILASYRTLGCREDLSESLRTVQLPRLLASSRFLLELKGLLLF